MAYEVSRPHEIRFKVGRYDTSRPLTIDPVVSYAEIVTGATNGTQVGTVAVDTDGSLVIAGISSDPQYPVINPVPPAQSANDDVFITKFDPTGETIVYSTFLPSQGFNSQSAIALDQAGNTAITQTIVLTVQ